MRQIKLTEKHVQGFMAVSEDMAKLYNGANPEKPDPKLEAQAEALVKKNGFGSLAEYDNVSMNISMIMSGIDQQSKKFTEPPEQIKKDIAALKSDKSVPETQKKEGLAQLEAALKEAKPIQFKENIALVLKYFDKLRTAHAGAGTCRLGSADANSIAYPSGYGCRHPGARAFLVSTGLLRQYGLLSRRLRSVGGDSFRLALRSDRKPVQA